MDFRNFLDEIESQTGKDLAVRVICDNLRPQSAHRCKWLLARPRFQLHFTLTYS
ncbi:hypothetical protein ACFWVB_38480 [Streptomyces microflavus]|uniref:hypothetical protein n=1 Tax=Streptomyces microflavus TaxID=1919 RepID=UPI00364A9A34